MDHTASNIMPASTS